MAASQSCAPFSKLCLLINQCTLICWISKLLIYPLSKNLTPLLYEITCLNFSTGEYLLRLLLRCLPPPSMVLILNSSEEHGHIWSKSGFSICWRHWVTSKESSNPIFFSRKLPSLLHTYAICSELPSYISTMPPANFIYQSIYSTNISGIHRKYINIIYIYIYIYMYLLWRFL